MSKKLKFKLMPSKAFDIAEKELALAKETGIGYISDLEVLNEIYDMLEKSGESAIFYRVDVINGKQKRVEYSMKEIEMALSHDIEVR